VLIASLLSDDPRANLQLGLGVELSVLPPYLYALWSIKPASEGAGPAAVEAANAIRAVVYEEMLHAALVGNLLHALGATPQVTKHLMSYPGPLPGHVTSGKYAYTVHLGPLSKGTIKTFMRIERPEWVEPEDVADGWVTLGAFYEKVKAQLRTLPPGAFGGGHQLPEGDNPGPGRMVQVDSIETALTAIETVLDQGEGHKPKRADDPDAVVDDDHEVAHYYQFEQIATYCKAGLIKPSSDLYPVIANPRSAAYSAEQRAANQAFNEAYTGLLGSLQAMWAADRPRVFGDPTALMRQLEHLAAELRALGPVGEGPSVAGPTFELVRASGAR
jgi:hypothetical protein